MRSAGSISRFASCSVDSAAITRPCARAQIDTAFIGVVARLLLRTLAHIHSLAGSIAQWRRHLLECKIMSRTIIMKMRTAILGIATLMLATYWGGAFAQDALIDAALASKRVPPDYAEDAWRHPRDVLKFLELAPGQH